LENQVKTETKKTYLPKNDSFLEKNSKNKNNGMKKVRSYDVLQSGELSIIIEILI